MALFAPRSSRPRRGATLLLTLLLTASMLATALNLAALVISGLRRATVSAAAFSPFYQAEGGLERAIFRIRQLQVLPSELNMGNECDTNLSCGGGDCMPGCSLDVSFPTTTTSLSRPVMSFPRVSKDQSVQIDLIDRTDYVSECGYDDGAGLSAAACVSRLRVYCRDLGGGELGSLVFTITRIGESDGVTDTWLSGGTEGSTSQDVYDLSSTDFRCSASAVSFDLDQPIEPSRSYVVKIRALYSEVEIPNIVAYDINNQLSSTFSRLQLTAVGTGNLVRQQVRATLPGRSPVLGLTDYLLYSECGLEKTTAAPGYTCP